MYLFLQPWELHKISHHVFLYPTLPTSNTPHPFPNPSLLLGDLFPLPKTSYFLENVCFSKRREKIKKKNLWQKIKLLLAEVKISLWVTPITPNDSCVTKVPFPYITYNLYFNLFTCLHLQQLWIALKKIINIFFKNLIMLEGL